jgi:COMPASS component SWD3
LGTNNLTVLLSSDGESLFAGTQAGEVRIWSLDSREMQKGLPMSGAPVIWLGQSRDGRILVVGQWKVEVSEFCKCRVSVWNLPAGQEVKSWTFSALRPCMAVSPDGHWVATGHIEGPVQICRLTDQSSLRTLNFCGRIRGVAFSPDGKLLAACSGEGIVKVWDLPNLRELAEFRAHTGDSYALAFSPDSRRLATASYGEEALKLWDVATWKELITLERPDQGVQQIAFSDDGRQLIGRDLQGDLLVWHAPSFAEIDEKERTRRLPPHFVR